MSGGEERVPKGYKQTEVGVIPEEWAVRELSLCIDVYRGGSPRPIGNYLTINTGGINWIKIGDVGVGSKYITNTAQRIIQEGIKNSREVFSGDLLLSNSMSFGRPYILQIDGCIHDGWLVLQNYQSDFSLEFLYYHLSSEVILSQYKRMAAGSSVLNLNKDIVSAVKLLVPPIQEQSRIEEVLSDSDIQIQALENLIVKKRDIKQGAMQELLTGNTRLPGFNEDWGEAKIGDLFEFKNGLNKSKQFFGHGTPVINYMDVYSFSGINNQDIHGKVSVTSQEQQNYSAKRGDVFFTRTSETVEEIGVAAVLLEDVEGCVFSGFVLRGRPISNRLISDYCKYCFAIDSVRKQIVSTASYTTRALTNGRLLSRVMLVLPTSIREQEAIAEVLSDMDAEIAALEQRLEKAKAIKQGMMQQLLTGRIRLVDPSTPVEASA